MEETCGGVAPWLPWQEAQVGAERSPRLETASQCTLVRYSSNHDPADEWVYNGADIDGSKVVWAREMSSADNLELIRYYPSRKVWLAEPDSHTAILSPYPSPAPGSLAKAAPTDDPTAAKSIGTGLANHD